MTIRPAVDSDRPALEAFCQAALEERQYDALFGIIDWSQKALEEDVVAVVAERDGLVIGCFLAALVLHPLSGRRYADQLLWYVAPAYRSGRVGPTLFRSIYEYCLTLGITQFRVVQPYDRPRWARYLRRLGFRPVEVGWILTCPAEASHERDVPERHRAEQQRC